MASAGISAQGTILEIDATVPGTADQAISDITTFSGFDGEASEVDTTSLESTAKEFILGLQDFGSFNVEMFPNYTDAGQNDLRAAATSGDLKTFKLTLPNATTVDFTAYVKNADSLSGGVDAAVTSSASLRVSGPITIT